jgi:hypothetical protein
LNFEGVAGRGVPSISDTWLAPAKRPLIDIAMSATAAPIMSLQCFEVRSDFRFSLAFPFCTSASHMKRLAGSLDGSTAPAEAARKGLATARPRVFAVPLLDLARAPGGDLMV